MDPLSNRFTLCALSLSISALVAGCGGGDALPPGVSTVPTSSTAPDTVAPTLTISDNTAGADASGPVTFTFAFSESVGTSFTANSVSVTGGGKGAFTMAANALSATLVVSPPANSYSGTLQVAVAAGAYSDAAGNQNTIPSSVSKTYQIPTGDTGNCNAAPCVGFDAAGVVLAPFGGLAASVAADPTKAANKVAKLVKHTADETWAGATVDTSGKGANTVAPVGFATSKVITLRAYSPAAGEVIMLKAENSADGGVNILQQVTTTKANLWEALSFDFTKPLSGTYDPSKTYDRISIFPHYNSKVSADSTYYFDELSYCAVPVAASGTKWVSFDEATPPTLTDFGGQGSGLVTDPASTCNKVLKIVKPVAANLWAGSTVSTGAGNSVARLPFAARATKMTLRSYSPAAGIHVRLKVEDAANSGHSVETEAVTTVANGWETLTFDFSRQVADTAALDLAYTYNKVSIFPDFGLGSDAATPMPAERSYYFDDLTFAAAAAAPLTYASKYTDLPAPWKSAEGGDAGRYIDGSVATQEWWSGNAPSDATPSFYFGYGINSGAKPWGFGAFVKAPANGTANVSAYANVAISVWGNDQLMNAHPTLTVLLKGPTVSGCTSGLKGGIAVTAPGVQTYTLPLSGFTLDTACAYASAAAALAAGVTEVHIQVLGSNVQYTTDGDASHNYPNGLNIGPIQFN